MNNILKKICTAAISGAAALSMLVSGCTVTAFAAEGMELSEAFDCSLIAGDNVSDQNYTVWASTVDSYMISLDDGYMKFQAGALADGSYLVEYYDADFKLTKAQSVPQELAIFGAFHSDGTYYYVLSGQTNYNEDNSVEVYRLTKYDKDWNRLGSAGLFGANTYIPFDAGSARIDSDGSTLFIRTCHEMYMTSDGYHHQANVTIQVNTSTMNIVDSFYSIMNVTYGYVSHSFNQFIQLDNGYLVGIDHGDAYERSVCLTKTRSAYTASGYSKSFTYKSMLDISGSTGANATGVSVGGFEVSGSNYLVAGNTVTMGSNYNPSGTRNIFVSSIGRNLSSSTTVNYITSYAEGSTSPSTPQFVKVDDDTFVLLWTKDGVVNYCLIDGNGKKSSEIYTMDGYLSDCAPIYADGKVIWYTYSDETTTFYTIDVKNPEKTEVLASGHIYDVEYPAEGSNVVKTKCQVCGTERTFTTLTSINSVYWWQLGGTYSWGSSYLSSSQLEGVTIRANLNSGYPSDAENTDVVVTSSDSNVARVEGNTFTTVGVGNATITVAAKYNPSAKITANITVSHDITSETILKEATCTEDGERLFSCSYCGDDQREAIPATGHDYEIIGASAANCTSDGTTVKQCKNCGDTVTEVIPAYGHKFTDWTVDVKPTAESNGRWMRYCSNCGDREYQEIPATPLSIYQYPGSELKLDETDGLYHYYEDGEPVDSKNGFVGYNGNVFFLSKGVVVATEAATGLIMDPYSSDWYYCAEGRVVSEYTGLALYDGSWFYVTSGKLDTTLAAVVNYDGGKFLVGAGRILTEVAGLAQDPVTGKWYYFANGQAQIQYTGLAQYDGAWFYIIAGELASGYTGTVQYNGATFNVVAGMVK